MTIGCECEHSAVSNSQENKAPLSQVDKVCDSRNMGHSS